VWLCNAGSSVIQVEAERKKRANILESEGVRESAINRAEGIRQSKILASEAMRIEQVNIAKGSHFDHIVHPEMLCYSLGEASAILAKALARSESLAVVGRALGQQVAMVTGCHGDRYVYP
jgi:regulator of protease activity HflC (stomatin/prohibitin superfamily)